MKKWRFRAAIALAIAAAFTIQTILGPKLTDTSIEIGFYIGVLLGRTIIVTLIFVALVAVRNWIVRRQRRIYVK